MLKVCSEACPAYVALQAAGLRWNKVAQRNHREYFIFHAVPLFQPSENKLFSSPTSLQEQNRKKR